MENKENNFTKKDWGLIRTFIAIGTVFIWRQSFIHALLFLNKHIEICLLSVAGWFIFYFLIKYVERKYSHYIKGIPYNILMVLGVLLGGIVIPIMFMIWVTSIFLNDSD